jgi:hypothetical protein
MSVSILQPADFFPGESLPSDQEVVSAQAVSTQSLTQILLQAALEAAPQQEPARRERLRWLKTKLQAVP